MKKTKRVAYTYLPKSWSRWDMYALEGILDMVRGMTFRNKKEAEEFYEEKCEKVKIEIKSI